MLMWPSLVWLSQLCGQNKQWCCTKQLPQRMHSVAMDLKWQRTAILSPWYLHHKRYPPHRVGVVDCHLKVACHKDNLGLRCLARKYGCFTYDSQNLGLTFWLHLIWGWEWKLAFCFSSLGKAASDHFTHPADMWARGCGGGSRREHHQKGRETWLLAMSRSSNSCLQGPRS